ncbi:3030_t:CDS:2 [Paraglomus brasilianum]|uniref:3030_t:CDS:1 n=1 Tax=Paraglomus brasilianum TaxID=144538 RepID=A0A9N9AXM4_9GLOM|nr:3030_t:CDS:2 [Paraglomus brasilianum]
MKTGGNNVNTSRENTINVNEAIAGGIFIAESSKKRDQEKDGRKDRLKRTKINSNMDGKIDEFFLPVSQRDQGHENMNNNRDNEELTITLEPGVPEEELEDNLYKKILV